MEHSYAKMTKTPLIKIGTGSDGEPVFVDDPAAEMVSLIGCMNCDMGVDEAEQGPCMGKSFDEMMEDS